jgi:hypothetical protein
VLLNVYADVDVFPIATELKPDLHNLIILVRRPFSRPCTSATGPGLSLAARKRVRRVDFVSQIPVKGR